MACVPSMAVPVSISTLNPNAINTFIVQTANVAFTQTASVPTLTATATQINTSTPEATFTLVAPIIFPSSTPTQREEYFRVKHDNQLAEFNYRSRTGDPKWPVDRWGWQTPEVVRLVVATKNAAGTHHTTITPPWEAYMDALNDYNKKTINYLKSRDTAIFDGNGFPQLESMTMGGNIITLDEVKNGWGRVHTMDYNDPGSVQKFDYTNRPDLVHKFVVVVWNRTNKTTYFVNPPPGAIYWPLVSSRIVWIPMENLEGFPQLPMAVTANMTQEIKAQPSNDSVSTGFELAEGSSTQVIKYYPSGSNVWGQVSGGGWIALLTHKKGAVTYPTSWQMATQPPP